MEGRPLPSPAVTTLAAARVITPQGVLAPGVVELDGGRIAAVAPTSGPVPDRTLAPGLIDLQVNGHDDVDVVSATGADWDRLDALLAAQGVTGWCPTLVTAPLDAYALPLARIASAATRDGPRPAVLGAHLEGPFLGDRPGAHPPGLIRPPDAAWLTALPPIVRIVTLAPEVPGALAAITALRHRDVVAALGHSEASYEVAVDAADAGARLVTHGFNAMSGLGHRAPGLVGAALADDRLAVSLIADLVHVHAAALTVAFRSKPRDRAILVTDAVAWRSERFAALGRVNHDGAAPRLVEGKLAGSALTLDRAVANVVDRCGVALDHAVAAASTNPADLLGLADRGRLAPGARADVVAFGPARSAEATWIAGTQVHG
ncbi:N-acetylglucosamine-6-phosphate deacetylase [soil metagenome]